MLWLIPTLPFVGFVVLVLFGRRIPGAMAATIGCASVGAAAGVALYKVFGFSTAYTEVLWTWFSAGEIAPRIAFRLDSLSVVMVLIVSIIGFLIHVYAAGYMRYDPDRARFFANMNLFIAAMLILVLADNLLLLYLGWEGVGLCSYLLIGFWYKDPANVRAANKAFIVTRIGDTAFAVGLFLLVAELGTLNIQEVGARATDMWPVGSGLAIAATALLLCGAIGKSAQLPLQVWLPDAMAGPTPVSALIHAATMVTAGVYLIARMHALFVLAPMIQLLIAVIGALTLLIAGCSALAQSDLKRVLAYSTISQLGYMFLALGVGAWSAAIFHLMTHAFFKALLFLCAGTVLFSLHHEQDMFKMGGLRRTLPVTFWTFLIGAGSLAGLPLVTSGFYSKDTILWEAFIGDSGGILLWAAGSIGAFLTSLYIFRAFFLVFFGEQRTPVSERPSFRMRFVLIALAVLSITGGFVELPGTMGHVHLFSGFVDGVLPSKADHGALGMEALIELMAVVVSLTGLYIAYRFVHKRRKTESEFVATALGGRLHRLWASGWGYDTFYDRVFVRPLVAIARLNRRDVVDSFYEGVGKVAFVGHMIATMTQTGRLRWYAAAIGIGAAFVVGIAVFT